MGKTKSILSETFESFADVFSARYKAQETEYEFFYNKCLVEPLEGEKEAYLAMFDKLSNEEKSSAIIQSKNWGDFDLMNKMQQLFTR